MSLFSERDLSTKAISQHEVVKFLLRVGVVVAVGVLVYTVINAVSEIID